MKCQSKSLPQTKLAYSVDEARTVIGLGRTRLFEEINSGRLLAVKAGKRTLIPARSIEAWLECLPSARGAA